MSTISPFLMMTNFSRKYLCNFAPPKYVLPLSEILKDLLTPLLKKNSAVNLKILNTTD